ncbi:hypothetical protein BCR44DRAFT_324243 [Catenaria anguillulae PL171]|uniref:Secreted protein n=1 Tax=Catenaria anguillulae PL171 TaxID=765915 RepID=A0A1Y2HCQ4_9FUNG|nr:hypothetical protein BCR44DRAFT_324243 [Catenaria anguillulae PL171]
MECDLVRPLLLLSFCTNVLSFAPSSTGCFIVLDDVPWSLHRTPATFPPQSHSCFTSLLPPRRLLLL